MQTRVLDPVPADDPGVGLVGEDVRQRRDGDRPDWAVAPPAVAQPAVRQFGGKALDGPLPGDVLLEGGGDERGALGVRDDVGDLSPADALAHVQVAERGGVRPAAHLRLLAHALSDLRGEVGRVELGHEGVDALDEPPRGGLLQVLGHRHERGSSAPQQRSDGDVVLEVAREAVDLVNDDSVDVAILGDAGEHRLQLRPIGRSRRLAPVGVLVDEAPALVADVADASLALGRDREALLAEAVLGLLPRRDPQVDHTAHPLHAPLLRSVHEGSIRR
ncbi:MAG: hypothetical protein M0Z69_12455 [Actinomycetota bacterium]|nr:hypothetical protein [Actinomycetota bacterium]